jgi:hypothetical protein
MRSACILFSCKLLLLSASAQQQPAFKKHIIHSDFISEGVAVADVNRDGLTDILAGPYWFEAPDWKLHQITTPGKYDYTKEWSDSFLNFAADLDADGWTDLIVFDFPGTTVHWFKNPGGSDMHWPQYLIDSTARNESPMMADVDRDGNPDLVFGTGNDQITWFRPAPDGPDEVVWNRTAVSEEKAPGGSTFSHGLGFGDMDLDGKADIFTTGGWWKAPDVLDNSPWIFQEVNLGQPCSQMYLYDLDLDGDQDVISASAHNYGIWWHQQSGTGQLTFTEHLIDSSFSQTHGLALEDINDDGLPDLITGKRYFAHNGKDPGGHEPAMLYWYELTRDGQNNPVWIRHLIDDQSGVGLQVVVQDIIGDNKKDILIANKKGVILFESY